MNRSAKKLKTGLNSGGQRLGYVLSLMLAALSLVSNMATGQSSLPDRIYSHRNKIFYVAGETLFFKVYLFNEAPSPSELIHADLIDSEGNVISESLLSVENNTCDGHLDIPLSLAEDIYFMRVYSIWNLNFDAGFNYLAPVPIYNDFEQTGSGSYVNATADGPGRPGNATLEIKLLNEKIIRSGDWVQLAVRDPVNKGGLLSPNVSVSVIDPLQCGYPDSQTIHESYERQDKLPHSPAEIEYQPENQILVEGKIRELSSGDPVNSAVLSVYNVETASFDRISSRNGEFRLKLPVQNGNTLLQVLNMNPFEPTVNEVEKKSFSDLIPLPEEVPAEPEKTPLVENYLYHSRIRRKIKEIYTESITDTLKIPLQAELPFVPDRIYQMDKYQLLKTVEDFVREAVVNTSHINENGVRKLLLFNQETKKYFMRPPWILVDGQFIFDDSLSYNIPFTMVRRIDIYNRNGTITRYFDPIMVQGGVVAVYTKNNYLADYVKALPNTLVIGGLTGNGEFNRPAYMHTSTLDAEPDLSPVIHWAPDVLLDKNGTAVIEFEANDLSGKYFIRVEGMDAAGKPVSGQLEIEVRP